MNITIPASLRSIANNLFDLSKSTDQDFQIAIEQGNVDLIQKLIDGGAQVDQPFSNGDLPLHLAVCANQENSAAILLAHGANPEAKDGQNLSAIDHSALMKNDKLLMQILGHKIGKDLSDMKEQIKSKGSIAHLKKIQDKMRRNSSVDVQNLSPLCKRVYEGECDVASIDNLSTHQINMIDNQGLALIHYAILGKQHDIVVRLIKNGANINVLNNKGDSLLH